MRLNGRIRWFWSGSSSSYFSRARARAQLPIPTPPLPPFLSDLTVTPSELELGDNVTIGLDIMNPNNRSITYIVTIRVEGIGQMGAHIEDLTLFVDVELGAYESETVQHTITPDVAGHYNVTVDGMTGSFVVVRPPLPANFVVLHLSASPDEVEKGENVTFTVLVINVGDTEGTYTVEFKVDGETIDIQNVTVAADSFHHVRAYYEALNVGAYHAVTHRAPHQVSVGDLTETFIVLAPFEPAEFEFSNLVITPRVKEGMSVNISVDVTNVGEEMGGCTVELKVNGHVVDSVEILPFGGGVTATQFFELTRGAGTYEVEVEGLTGSFAVFIPASERAESTMIVIVIIVCIVAISVWRLGGFEFATRWGMTHAPNPIRARDEDMTVCGFCGREVNSLRHCPF